MLARRDAAGVRLLTRNAIDWAGPYPGIASALNGLRCRSSTPSLIRPRVLLASISALDGEEQRRRRPSLMRALMALSP
jgi:hypothetical protein